ncbi:DUF4097 family beta strand repeat-containing protein [Gordonibacter massiliensis (ex Traore et al. 2017)]|uniref:DUF4097 family beta strand repeat-containing protein n=1 Tax=Gordonibacter massiliensis (ex Traore et al. 2017) TaxID=1841863 RepID=UPI001C8B3C99|nr:DUF4097 family beta strand repeat-containing protein [Gordonibacter massiliensis (ex Traore et al. 2017)]MBX9034532.1 DUF4097 domain-containing protein [Gordonibacter massiliensis (ex Traore et al. 2017)]
MAKLTRSSYVKIALIIALGLLLFAVAGLGSMRGCSSQGFYLGGGAEMGNASVDAKSVKNLSISWAAGSVDVSVVDDAAGDTIELVETAPNGMTKAQQMRWSVSGDTLKVDYGSWWSCFALGQKRLEVRIPERYARNLGNVAVDGASGYYRVSGIGCDALNFKLASGEIDADDLAADTLGVDVASGQARVEGSFANRVSTKTASGQLDVVCLGTAPRQVDADLASGQTSVALPEDTGFSVKVDKASGSFASAFETTQQGNSYLHGDGTTSIGVHIASGQFSLEKSRG